jgi:sec-independent protein translocase protein TatA
MNLAFIQGIGPLELSIVLVIVLLVVGPKRLPGVARSVGTGMKEFKDSLTGGTKDDDDEIDVKTAKRSALGAPEEPATAPAESPVPAAVVAEPQAQPQPVATERG